MTIAESILILVCFFVLCGFLCPSCAAQNEAVQIIPIKVLFGNPDRVNPKISPDGEFIAFLAPEQNVLNIWLRDQKTKEEYPITHDSGRGIHYYFWSYTGKTIFFLQDTDGDENWLLKKIDVDNKTTTNLTPLPGVQVRVIEYNKERPNEMLLAINHKNPKLHDAYHLDTQNGKLTLVEENPGNVSEWIADTTLTIRAVQTNLNNGDEELRVKDQTTQEWKTLLTWNFEDAMNSGQVMFSQDGTELYFLDSRNFNTNRLCVLNLKTSNFTILAQDEQYDITSYLVHPDTYKIQAVSFLRDRLDWKIIDPKLKKDFGMLRSIKGDINITSRTNDDTKWVIGFSADTGPISYYLFDRSAKKITFLFDHKPKLRNYNLAPMKPITLTSRDGLTLHGYITYPLGKKEQNLPVVLNVHGGPWARDTWGYDPEAQWLANRGYACLQINFRGSSGYGKTFLNAGNKEWGNAMHNDLVDAVHWAIQRGIADPKRIAIYGGSYGGYAALVGASFTPDLFSCAVDIVGPSNLITFINSIPPYWHTFLATMHKRVGNPDTEAEFLRSRSPLFKVDQIKIPLFVAQGANDPRVNKAESEQIIHALQKKNIPYEYLLFPDEGHGFVKPENREKFYQQAEKFLARCLGGHSE